MTEKINVKKVVDYWRGSAQRSRETAEFLYKGKKYPEALFFCHLMIEKLLKGLIVQKTKTHAPYRHELDFLAEKTNLALTESQIQNLKIISTFNIRARYDNIKQAFYKKCTKEYAEEYFNIANKLYLWLKKQYHKK